MNYKVKCPLLSLGASPRNTTLQWLSDNRLVYCGLRDICVVSKKNSELVPEAVFSVLTSPDSFRSFRVAECTVRTDNQFEVIATTTAGKVVVYAISLVGDQWECHVKYEDLIAANEMVDAFLLYTSQHVGSLAIATFNSIEFRFFNDERSTKRMKSLRGFCMIQCFFALHLGGNSFLFVFGQTDKKLGLNIFREDDDSDELEPVYVDSKEAVFCVDARVSFTEDDRMLIELIAATENRVQIWNLVSTSPSKTQSTDEFAGFSLQSKKLLRFNHFYYDLHLDANILASPNERISHAKFNYKNASFSISTRENTIKIFGLSGDDSSQLWVLQREVCSYGEPALELCGIFDAVFSPNNQFFIAHNTIGGFYFFKVDKEMNFEQLPVYIGGHSGKVKSLCWHNKGQALLTVGSDKTTRYFEFFDNGVWAQKSRPQVHGHAIRCIASMESAGFVSGSAEHMFRAFNNTIPQVSVEQAVDFIQPLNLTPKPRCAASSTTTTSMYSSAPHPDPNAPAVEELLQSGATVHEEVRKLYGHGNECYAVESLNLSTEPPRALLFTAAKGSRPDESQLIVWSAPDWKVLQRLQQHALTITDMRVSPDAAHLLVVSRDRSWSLYSIDPTSDTPLTHLQTQPQAHKRVIWSVSWHPKSQLFATASRDHEVALYQLHANSASEVQRWKLDEPLSALEFGQTDQEEDVLVVGTEKGNVHVVLVHKNQMDLSTAVALEIREGQCTSSLIYKIRFNPHQRLFALCTESGLVKAFIVTSLFS